MSIAFKPFQIVSWDALMPRIGLPARANLWLLGLTPVVAGPVAGGIDHLIAAGNAGLLTAREAAMFLRVSLSTLWRLEQRGLIVPFRTPGGHRRYSRAMLESYLDHSRIDVPVAFEPAPYKSRQLRG